MNNISFKAKIYGLPQEITAKLFEWKTENDQKHELQLLTKDSPEDKDTFIMRKNGRQTITYQPEDSPVRPGFYNIDQLMSIFNLMKVLEAKDYVNKSIVAKQSKLKQSEFEAKDN